MNKSLLFPTKANDMCHQAVLRIWSKLSGSGTQRDTGRVTKKIQFMSKWEAPLRLNNGSQTGFTFLWCSARFFLSSIYNLLTDWTDFSPLRLSVWYPPPSLCVFEFTFRPFTRAQSRKYQQFGMRYDNAAVISTQLSFNPMFKTKPFPARY